MSLKNLTKNILSLKQRTHRNPMEFYRPTPPQLQFHKSNKQITLLSGGNQCGKTTSAVAELIWRCTNTHPYKKTDPAPITCYLVTHSHQQSVTIQRKLWELLPKDLLDPSVEFVSQRGFRGINPVVKFANGSLIEIKTAKQGLGLASATLSYCLVDEPINKTVFGEILGRVVRGGAGGKSGQIGITMTPVGEDVSYLKKMIEEGKIECIYAPLTVKATTPVGLRPLLTQAQIDEIASKYLPIDREARLLGSFSVGVPEGRVFDNFEPTMISAEPCPRAGLYKFAIGIDHGTQPNTQCAVLSAVDIADSANPKIYILGEYVSGGAVPPEQHARGILELLQYHQIDPKNVIWTGDNVHYSMRGNKGNKMSNAVLMRAFEKVMGLSTRQLPWRIATAHKPKFSVYYSAGRIHSIMSQPDGFKVRPECVTLIEALQRWTLKNNQSRRSEDRHGHIIDAMRYCLMPLLDIDYRAPHKIRIY